MQTWIDNAMASKLEQCESIPENMPCDSCV
jgi:hypothetical protein